jgi:hypothetical protein
LGTGQPRYAQGHTDDSSTCETGHEAEGGKTVLHKQSPSFD